MGMGRYVKVTGRMGSQLAVRHELGKETFYATIDRAYRDSFNIDDDIPGGWCPFLRRTSNSEVYACIIHQNRPVFCKKFICCRMRIYNREGRVAGRLRGSTTLLSDDDRLEALWEHKIRSLSTAKAAGWQKTVEEILMDEGYSVEIYE
jgi:Fe-S-cluster containining protein